VHKIAGRGLFIAVAVHGSLWIRDRLIYHETILGAAKTATGVAGFAMLCVIILTTLRPFRERFYQSFFIIQYVIFLPV
jgi:ferric-chelate reductase